MALGGWGEWLHSPYADLPAVKPRRPRAPDGRPGGVARGPVFHVGVQPGADEDDDSAEAAHPYRSGMAAPPVRFTVADGGAALRHVTPQAVPDRQLVWKARLRSPGRRVWPCLMKIT